MRRQNENKMRVLKNLSILVAMAITANPALADTNHPGIPPAEHGPIGVMQDHMHEKGEWMVSYRYMHMEMGGNKVGTAGISTADTLDQFMVAPPIVAVSKFVADNQRISARVIAGVWHNHNRYPVARGVSAT